MLVWRGDFMREKILFDDNWIFHRGDIDIDFPKDKEPVYTQSKTERKLWGPASKYYKGKVNVYCSQINERCDYGKSAYYNAFGTMVCKFAYIHKVVCKSAHYLACFVAVKKPVGKPFEMAEHITAHLCLHVNAHHMSLVLYKKVK